MPNSRSKTDFILAFAAIALTFFPFRESVLFRVDLGFAEVPIGVMVNLFLGALGLSVYFYAIDSLKYSRKNFEKNKLSIGFFKVTHFLAQFLYIYALVGPLVIAFLWLFVELATVAIPSITQNLETISTVLAGALGLLTGFFAKSQVNQQRELKNELFQTKINESGRELNYLVQREMWSAAIMTAFINLEIALNQKLSEIGIDSKKMQFYRQLEILKYNRTISEQDFKDISSVRQLRNRVAHTHEKISKQEALKAIDLAQTLVTKLTNSSANALS